MCAVSYTLSVYETQDLNTKPLLTSSHTVQFISKDMAPSVGSMDRISGELNTDIPFTINVSKAGFLQGQPAKIKIYLNGSFDGLTLSGEYLEQDLDNKNMYVMSIPSFSATQHTLTVRATKECSGNLNINICDEEGYEVGYGSTVSYAIPANFSEEDIAALKAIAEANPLNNDLQNFIANKEYLKDRMPGDGYNVGVTWNTEAPSRVKSFFVDDYRTYTVSSLDLSALIGMENLDLYGTRVQSLDLSALTNLRHINLMVMTRLHGVR